MVREKIAFFSTLVVKAKAQGRAERSPGQKLFYCWWAVKEMFGFYDHKNFFED